MIVGKGESGQLAKLWKDIFDENQGTGIIKLVVVEI